jgi:signal-transduction protein with cAMP-binding, CBS, and nucleotidyltransferase domain
MYPIKDVMVSPIISIDSQAVVETVAKLMSEKKISSLLVKEGEEYVGIVTKTDIIEKVIAEGGDPKTTKVDSIMSKPLFSLDQYKLRSEANVFMLRNHIKHLLVTQGKNILGILTTKDMVS